jgi:pimeloyl-ACP methyl ester carboxylesterase
MKTTIILALSLLASVSIFSAFVYQDEHPQTSPLLKEQTASSIAETMKYPYQTASISLTDNIDIAYRDTGKGATTLLFIHGLGSYMRAWDKNIEDLAASYRCVAVDLPGYGKSSKIIYNANMSFYAKVLRDFIRKKQLGKVVLVGHSMGGQIALTMAIEYPEAFEHIILIDPAGFESFNNMQKTTLKNFTTVQAVKNATETRIRQHFAANFFKMPTDAEMMINDRLAMRNASDFDDYCLVVTQNVAGMLDEPVFARLNKIKKPVTCLFGSRDALIPNRALNPHLTTEAVAKSGVAAIRDCQFIMIPDAGHFAMWEKPSLVNQEIRGAAR